MVSVRQFKDKIDDKDKLIEEKNKLIEEKNKLIEEKNKLIEEKNKTIEEKNKAIRQIEESAEIATALREAKRVDTGRKWGK